MNIKKSTLIRPITSCLLCSVFLALAGWAVSAKQTPSGSCHLPPPSDAYATTVQYVETFYPLWFTFNQAQTLNRMDGPERVSPLYHIVVMINDDTVYCSSFLNLNPTDTQNDGQPMMILTIPSTVSPETCSDDTSVTYSILPVDPYGDVSPTPIPAFAHGSPPIQGGTYALTGPLYTGVPPIPAGVQQIQMPVSYPSLLFRIDKYHSFTVPPNPPDYVNQIDQADRFRLSLQLQKLDEYQNCQHGGHTLILPEIGFAKPYKTEADTMIAADPIRFLSELQTAVHSPRTPPSACAQALSDQFDQLFGNGNWKKNSDFGRGAQRAHGEIVDNYVTNPAHQLPGNWTHFTNIGEWNGDIISDAIDRSSITEFCQYCNDISAAAYYHAFRDSAGRPLNGNNPHGYVLTFPAATPYPGPETSRFWSVTAYTPQAIELIPNSINTYEVASYSGAHLNPDGSLSIYMATEQPAGVPIENWLPVANGPFNIVLRDYGPEGSVVNNTYTPPAVHRLP